MAGTQFGGYIHRILNPSTSGYFYAREEFVPGSGATVLMSPKVVVIGAGAYSDIWGTI